MRVILASLLFSLNAWGLTHTGELLVQRHGSDKIEVLKSSKTDLEKSGQYKFVAYNTIETTPAISEETTLEQWHHTHIQTMEAWRGLNTRTSLIVAVCDSGAQADHEDLTGRLLPGFNLVDNVSDNSTTTSHGTFVAGLIAANLNEYGVVGVAPFIKILPIRISNETGSTTMKLITDCIQMAADRGAKVINVSFTGVNHPAVGAAGEYAAKKGALLVYAAGNAGYYRPSASWPNFTHVLAVGATDQEDKRWKYYVNEDKHGGSNYGPFVDIMAPGFMLTSTTIYDGVTTMEKYRTGSGTSYAAPLVSAAAAIMFMRYPTLTPKEVETKLKRGADSMSRSNTLYGAGRLNIKRALTASRRLP
jgi:subtilisin family serine protease